MMLRIETDDGSVYNLPYSVDEIVYEDYIDQFKVHERRFHEEIKKHTVTPFDQKIEDAVEEGEKMRLIKQREQYELTEEQTKGLLLARQHLIAAISSIVEGDFNKIPYHSNVELKNDFYYHPDLEGAILSVEGVYKHLITLIESFKPNMEATDPVFTINGEPYYVTMTEMNGLISGVTVGEMIVNLSIKGEASKYYTKNEYGDGSMDFSMGLKEIAVLARPKGVLLPYKPLERSIYINEKIKLFQEARLSLQDVLRVRFFFINFIHDYIIQEHISFSGTSRSNMNIAKITIQHKQT